MGSRERGSNPFARFAWGECRLVREQGLCVQCGSADSADSINRLEKQQIILLFPWLRGVCENKHDKSVYQMESQNR